MLGALPELSDFPRIWSLKSLMDLVVLRAPQPQAIDVEERLWADCDLTAFIKPWDGSAHST